MTKKSPKIGCVYTANFSISTKGFCDILDITASVQSAVAASGFAGGIAVVFVPGSTAGITTIEYEPGVIEDLKETFEKLAPEGKEYHHNARWGDGNGFAHVRASLLGAEKSFPFDNWELSLGTWQQIIMVDFDNRPRTRSVIVKVIGE